jgi:hypothetical protein
MIPVLTTSLALEALGNMTLSARHFEVWNAGSKFNAEESKSES